MKKKTLYIVLSATALLLLLVLLIGASNGFNGFLKSIGRDAVPDSDSPIIIVDPDGSASDAESEPESESESDSDNVSEPHVVELGIEDFFVFYDYTNSSGDDYVSCCVGTSELKPSTKYKVDIYISAGMYDKETFSPYYTDGEYYYQYCPYFSVEEEPEFIRECYNQTIYDILDSSFVIETSAEELNDNYGFVICLGKAYSDSDDAWVDRLIDGDLGYNQYLGYVEGYDIFDYFDSRGFSVTFTEVIEYEVLFDNLLPCLFKYNDGTSDRLHSGFIAQEVKDAMDAAGIPTSDFAALCIANAGKDTEEWSLRYEEFVALNTYEIQKLKKRLSELEKIINV